MIKFRISRFIDASWREHPLITFLAVSVPLFSIFSSIHSFGTAFILSYVSFIGLVMFKQINSWNTQDAAQKLLDDYANETFKIEDPYPVIAKGLVLSRFAPYVDNLRPINDFKSVALAPIYDLTTVPAVKEPELLEAALHSEMDKSGITLYSLIYDIYDMQQKPHFESKLYDINNVAYELIDVCVRRGHAIPDETLLKILQLLDKYRNYEALNFVVYKIVSSLKSANQLNEAKFRQWLMSNPYLDKTIITTLDKIPKEQKTSILDLILIDKLTNHYLKDLLQNLQSNISLLPKALTDAGGRADFEPFLQQIQTYLYNYELYDAAYIAVNEPKITSIAQKLYELSEEVLRAKKEELAKEITINERLISSYHVR